MNQVLLMKYLMTNVVKYKNKPLIPIIKISAFHDFIEIKHDKKTKQTKKTEKSKGPHFMYTELVHKV